jgi:signal transduction histidine kinase
MHKVKVQNKKTIVENFFYKNYNYQCCTRKVQRKERKMNVKKAFWLLLMSLLITGSSSGQTSTAAKSTTGEKIDGLIKELKGSQEGPKRVDILLELCKAYINSAPGKALDYAKQGLTLSKKINYHEGISDSFHQLGVYYFYQGNYSNALEYYSKSLNIREELGDRKGAAKSYNNIGIVYAEKGNYPKALEFYDKSIKIMEELGDKKFVSYAYINIGLFYQKTGNYPQAVESFFKSLKILEELKDKKGISISYNNIAAVYESIGNYQNALEYNFKSLKIKEELEDKNAISYSYLNIGFVYFDQEDYSSALEYYYKSLKLSEELGEKNNIANLYSNIGKAQLRLKNAAEALVFYWKSKKISEEIGSKPGLSVAYLGIGLCHNARGETKKAIDYLTRALNIARDINLLETVKSAAEELNKAYAKIGQFKQAYQYHMLFKEKSDNLRNEENVKKITQLEMQYEFEKKQKQRELEQQKKDLEKDAELRQQRLLIFTFSGVAVLLAFVFYTLYRLKAKVNQKLRKEIRDRQQAEAELLKSTKLETVGILSSGIAHDFNNLLAIIVGNLGLIKDSLNDPGSQPEIFLETAEKASDQAVELVEKFLTISEGGWIKRTRVTLPGILEDTMASSTKIKQIPCVISLPEDLKPLFGDERQLRQVMVNLLLNAHEATSDMNENKRISISAENIILHNDNQWKLSGGEYVKISVIDNGKGIPQDLLGKISDPYFSTKERGVQKGMGMGLAVCNAIVRRHGGHLAVTSNLQKGTTVDFYIPVYNEK